MRLFLYFPLVATYLLSSFVGVRSLQSFLRLQNLNDLFWRGVSAPDADSSTRDCTRWLKSRPTSLIYPYGVNTTSSGARSLLACLQRHDALAARAAITEIAVAFPIDGEPDYKQQPLFQLVNTLPNLETVKWPEIRRNHPGYRKLIEWSVLSSKPRLLRDIPSESSSSIQRSRSLHQESGAWTVTIPDPDRDAPPQLIECNTDTISLSLSGWSHGLQDRLNHLYETLINCPKIHTLSLGITQAPWPVSFPFQPGDRFPNLTSLKITGYDWDAPSQHRHSSWTRLFSWLGHSSPSGSNALAWKEAMDWIQIRVLDMDSPPPSFRSTFSDTLQSLESLTLRPDWRHGQGFNFNGDPVGVKSCQEERTMSQEYTEFIASLPPLRDLDVGDLDISLNMTSILDRHSDSLKSLNIRSLRYLPCGHPLRYEDIEDIALSALNLESLEMAITEEPPYDQFDTADWLNLHEYLDAVAVLPKLKDLAVHVSGHMDVPDWDRFDEWSCLVPSKSVPFLNMNTTRENFEILERYQREKTGVDVLERMTFLTDVDGVPVKWRCRKDANVGVKCAGGSVSGGRAGHTDHDDLVALAGLVDGGTWRRRLYGYHPDEYVDLAGTIDGGTWKRRLYGYHPDEYVDLAGLIDGGDWTEGLHPVFDPYNLGSRARLISMGWTGRVNLTTPPLLLTAGDRTEPVPEKKGGSGKEK